MKILALIKQVPGTSNVEVDEETGVLKRDGVESKLNPYDLFAIEEALKIANKTGGEVTAVTMGPPQARSAILESMYMGVKEGYIISDRRFAGADVLATSHTISQGISAVGNFDLIICGKQTTDGDTAQVGPETAEFLGIPHAANIISIEEITDKDITVRASIDTEEQIIKMTLPALITMEKDANVPRLPSLKRKYSLGDVEVKILSMDDFEDKNEASYGLKGSPTQVERIFPPEKNTDKQMITGSSDKTSQEIFSILRNNKFI